MSQLQITKAWTITPNIRIPYVSLPDVAGGYIYQNHSKLVAVGWTVVWTCDGTTGPTDASDHTDRMVSNTAGSTRGLGNDMLNDIYPARNVGFQTALFAGDKRSLRLRTEDPRCRDLTSDLVVTDLGQLIQLI